MAQLVLPRFPTSLFDTRCVYGLNKKTDSKMFNDALCIKATFAAMLGKHIHTLSGKKRPDIEAICQKKYHELVDAAAAKYTDCEIVQFLPYVTMKKIKKLEGPTIYRLSQKVRSACTTSFNKFWEDCLGPDGIPPSGRQFEWVRMRVLVMLYRSFKKNSSSLPANQGLISYCVHACFNYLYFAFIVHS